MKKEKIHTWLKSACSKDKEKPSLLTPFKAKDKDVSTDGNRLHFYLTNNTIIDDRVYPDVDLLLENLPLTCPSVARLSKTDISKLKHLAKIDRAFNFKSQSVYSDNVTLKIEGNLNLKNKYNLQFILDALSINTTEFIYYREEDSRLLIELEENKCYALIMKSK